MKIVFFGSTELGYKCCEALIQNNENVVGIFTIPKKFKISYSKNKVDNVLHADFHTLGRKYNIPVIGVEGMNDKVLDEVRKLAPDFLLAVGWYYMIPKNIREMLPLGSAGIHASLLPKYRGGAPLVWAMINGEKKTGVTLFYFDEGVDTGDIIDQVEFEILPDDNIRHLLQKAEISCISMVKRAMPKIANQSTDRIQQNNDEASSYAQRKPEDGLINWEWDPVRIKNFIKAQTKPYPGAYTIQNGLKITIWEADIEKILEE